MTVTRKLVRPLPAGEAEAALRRLMELSVVQVDPDLILAAAVSSRRDRISFWDALILAADSAAGMSRSALRGISSTAGVSAGCGSRIPFADSSSARRLPRGGQRAHGRITVSLDLQSRRAFPGSLCTKRAAARARVQCVVDLRRDVG